ncbi:MAG: hypothetical protein KDD03_01600 [Gelidibacter sp.]|nr:hypothetical protein [Gelidibacter sp.]
MTKVFFVVSFLLGSVFYSFSQESINDYKYVIIPNHYDFLSEEDQYQLNSLTKFLFNKYGFTAFLQNDELPDDLRNNRCLALFVDVNKLKSFLKLKLQIELKNCDNQLILASKEGESREKEYDKAYTMALRDAFETYQHLEYKYTPNEKLLASRQSSTAKTNTDEKAEIERLQKELELLKEEKKLDVESTVVQDKIAKKEPEIKQVSTPTKVTDVLYAQAITNGFQVVDSTPKVVMILLETAKSNTFVVKGQNAIVYEEDGFWYLSRNDGTNISQERLNIKF